MQRQEERGALDWLVPFIPPVLRVNRDTRAALRRRLGAVLAPEALAAAAQSAASALRAHWRPVARFAVGSALWLRALYWVDRHAAEFTAAFVILSGFAALGTFVLAPGDAAGARDGLSAYSVFNRGGLRMLGSLSAEQFEARHCLPSNLWKWSRSELTAVLMLAVQNEIRHRDPRDGDGADADARVADRDASDQEDEMDEEMLLALRLSLQEKKREERRTRRATRRR